MGARLAAYLSYRDAPAALAWLQTLGFEVVRRADAPDGTVAHAEVRCDDVVLMVASYDAQYRRPPLVGSSTGGGLYLVLDDAAAVDDRFARATAAGGRAVIAPEDTEWGTRRARVLDPEGGEWSFGTYAPGESW
ncbi:VOC family protein [Blastococcus sp. SYSU D00922]